MKFFSILLKEGRKEDLRKKYSTKFNEEDLEFILNISDLQDFNHKYTDFVLKNTDGDGELDTSKLEKLVDLIKDFDKYQSQLEKKDINQYANFSELEDMLQPVYEKKKIKELENQAEKIYEDEKFLVLRPLTQESSCKYGSNTKWCVTQKNTGHFYTYTRGNQKLYFIINKEKSTENNYAKIAVHFNDEGYPTYWDAKDENLSRREIALFEYAFPNIVEEITQHFKKGRMSGLEKYVKEIFDISDNYDYLKSDIFNTDYTLGVIVTGFDNVQDMGYGHAEGSLIIYLKKDGQYERIDSYTMFILYYIKDISSFNVDIGFQSKDDENDIIDLELQKFELKKTINVLGSKEVLAENLRSIIANSAFIYILHNEKLKQKILGDVKIFIPKHGYTFEKYGGLVKKLIEYLDSGEIGTKLDFLEKIGKLKSKIENGRKLYSKHNVSNFRPKSEFRGQHSSFFSAAKNSGILSYRKIGSDFFLIKGPNFDYYKRGKLRMFR